MILIIDFSNTEDKKRLYKELNKVKPVPYWIELKIDRDKRSNRQNRYFHGVVLPLLSEHTGFTTDEIKSLLKGMFLTYYKDLPNGLSVELTKGTAELDTKEFEEFMDKVRMFSAQELDVQVPLPNEVVEI